MISVKYFKKLIIVTFMVGIILSSGCLKGTDSSQVKSKNSLENVRFWAYQIQNTEDNIQKLASSHYDFLIIDQTRSLRGEENYNSKADVLLLKNSPNSSGGRKIVLCYMDVGEAESYRWYWQEGWRIGNPDWIVAEDPDGWDENYPVKFWKDEWKDIMKRYVDRIIEDGYDGVYLDWLEVYSFEPVAAAAEAEGLDARVELIKFVRELHQYAHKKDPDFLFIAQNAAELGEYPDYLKLFDAISQEAIWYDGGGDPDTAEHPGDVPVDPEDSNRYVNNLKKWQQLKKPVFNVEYAQKPSNVERAYWLGLYYGFKTYVTLRPLETLTNTPPPGY